MHGIRVGIVGFGRIGAKHATWLAQADGIGAAAVCDVTPARLARASELTPYTDLAELLADPSIDAVLVATPSAMHFKHASRALEAGKHVMVEKPMTLTLDEARKLVEQAQSSGLVFSVFHNRRWDIDYFTVRDAVIRGDFGKIINVESRICQFASCVGPAAKEWRPNWRNEAAFGGGGLYDWGSHLLDQIWQLMLPARPLRVFAQLRGNVWTNDCDDFARIIVDFDNGAVGLVEINTTTSAPLPRWHIDGTLGSAQAPSDPRYRTSEWAKVSFTPSDRSSPHLLPLAEPGLTETQIWEHFARAIRGAGEPAVPVQSVLPTMALLDAARTSSQTGAAVDVFDAFAKV